MTPILLTQSNKKNDFIFQHGMSTQAKPGKNFKIAPKHREISKAESEVHLIRERQLSSQWQTIDFLGF